MYHFVLYLAVGVSHDSGSEPYRPRTDIPQKERETRLHQVAVQLIEGEAINSTAIKIYWQVCGLLDFMPKCRDTLKIVITSHRLFL